MTDWDPSAQPHELLYVRVSRHLAGRIESGELPPGTQLPPELEIAAEYAVAYHTVRSALRILRDRRMVASVQGRGTFVLSPPWLPEA